MRSSIRGLASGKRGFPLASYPASDVFELIEEARDGRPPAVLDDAAIRLSGRAASCPGQRRSHCAACHRERQNFRPPRPARSRRPGSVACRGGARASVAASYLADFESRSVPSWVRPNLDVSVRCRGPASWRSTRRTRTRHHTRTDPYRDLKVIDSRAPRFNQVAVGVGSLLAVVTGFWPLLALLGAQLGIGLRFGRRYCLPCVAYFELIQPRSVRASSKTVGRQNSLTRSVSHSCQLPAWAISSACRCLAQLSVGSSRALPCSRRPPGSVPAAGCTRPPRRCSASRSRASIRPNSVPSAPTSPSKSARRSQPSEPLEVRQASSISWESRRVMKRAASALLPPSF